MCGRGEAGVQSFQLQSGHSHSSCLGPYCLRHCPDVRPSPGGPGVGLRGSEVVQCIKMLLAPANIALSCGPTRPPLLGAGVGIGGGAAGGGRREEGRGEDPGAQLASSSRQGLTVLPQVGHKLVGRGVEEGGHIVIQRVHVLGQPGTRVVVHLPRTSLWSGAPASVLNSGQGQSPPSSLPALPRSASK